MCCVPCAGQTFTDISRPLANEKKMSSKTNVNDNPRAGDSRSVAHKPVTQYDTLPIDDSAKPTGQDFLF